MPAFRERMKKLKHFILAILLFCLVGSGLAQGETPSSFVCNDDECIATIYFTAVDSVSGVDHIQIGLTDTIPDEMPEELKEIIWNPKEPSLSIKKVSMTKKINFSPQDGDKCFYVRAQNGVGLWSDPVGECRKVDNTPPIVKVGFFTAGEAEEF